MFSFKTSLMILASAGLSAEAAARGNPAPDEGFNFLYKSNPKLFGVCTETYLPSYMNGTFIIPSLGLFENGDREFVGALDPFGKFNRFQFTEGGLMCFASQMINGNFYESSVGTNTIGPGMLFEETNPPRPYEAMQNMMGPNDNTFVNTYKMGDNFRAVTDSVVELVFNLETMNVIGNVTWKDAKTEGIGFGAGSAHPIREPGSVCYLNYHGHTNKTHRIVLYRLCPDQPETRAVVNSYDNPRGYNPYFHSWGLTSKHAIFPHQHFKMDYTSILLNGGILDKAFKDVDVGQPTDIYALPLDGSAPTVFQLDGEVFFTHFVNSYESPDGTQIISDFINFGDNAMKNILNLPEVKQKSVRDSLEAEKAFGVVTRMTLDRASKKATLKTISPKNRLTDFPTINPTKRGLAYCYFYAVEWFHDGVAYGSMAIVKYDLCKGEQTVSATYAHNAMFPSEPTFIDDPSSDVEDQGVVVFTMLDGTINKSVLVALDASTFKELAVLPLGTSIGFTTHGQFYAGVL